MLLRDPGIERDGFGIGRQDDPPGASFHQRPLPSSPSLRCIKVGGALMRALARRLSASLPQASYDGLQLLIGDASLAPQAETFFERTRVALSYASAHAYHDYGSLRKDTRSIVLRRETTTPPYNDSSSPFWFPPRRALEADAPVYAAWLLYASGLSRDTREAADRSASIERALEPAQRQQLRGLFASIDGVGDMSAEREDGSRAR